MYDSITKRETLRMSVRRKATVNVLHKDQLKLLQEQFVQIQAKEEWMQQKQGRVRHALSQQETMIDEEAEVMKRLKTSKVVLLGYEHYPLDKTILYILTSLSKLVQRLMQNCIQHNGGRFHQSFRLVLKGSRK